MRKKTIQFSVGTGLTGSERRVWWFKIVRVQKAVSELWGQNKRNVGGRASGRNTDKTLTMRP